MENGETAPMTNIRPEIRQYLVLLQDSLAIKFVPIHDDKNNQGQEHHDEEEGDDDHHHSAGRAGNHFLSPHLHTNDSVFFIESH